MQQIQNSFEDAPGKPFGLLHCADGRLPYTEIKDFYL